MDSHSLTNRRPASVLILTLVVIALLTLGAGAFFERMFAEHRAARAYGRQLQSRQFAESGVEYAKFLLTQDPSLLYQSGGLFANPSLFQGVLVNDDPLAAFRGRFTLLAPDLTTDGYYSGVRYGLENESSRLNLNIVPLADHSGADAARKLLMTIPGMTEPAADAILDWIDTDDQPRMFGAEREYYSTLEPPYLPRNGPLQSIEELLLVRDVTPALLFGADLNRNALVDAGEQQFTAMDMYDNSGGLLNRGWAAYLTLDSAEKNVRADGQPKIDVNMDDLSQLHTQLAQVLDQEMANFIVAFRQGGPYDSDDNNRGGTGGGGSRGDEGSGGRGEATASGSGASGAGVPKQASSIILDLEQPGSTRLNTILDLIGSKTRVVEKGQTERTVVETPFSDEPGRMVSYLPKLMENLTANSSPIIPGRININQAPQNILAGIPGIPAGAVAQIIADRNVLLTPDRPEQAHETWLLTEGIVDLRAMKRLMPFVTTGGSVYRAQVIGYFDADGPGSRLEVVIDASQSPPVIKRRRELDDLGGGYSLDVLGAQPDAIE